MNSAPEPGKSRRGHPYLNQPHPNDFQRRQERNSLGEMTRRVSKQLVSRQGHLLFISDGALFHHPGVNDYQVYSLNQQNEKEMQSGH